MRALSADRGAQVERVERIRNAVIALGILLACWPCAFALDPSLDVTQYSHTAWKVSEGFAKGLIRSIAQPPDGYLWLCTEFGLLRFDGVRAVPWQPPARENLPSSDIRSLRGARDGRLWIGTYGGLASWKDGKLAHYPELDGQIVEALLEDREGAIWVAAGWTPSAGKLCRIPKGAARCQVEDGLLGSGVTAIYEDSGDNLWVGTMKGVWRWKPGPPTLYPIPIADPKDRIYALSESDDGGILIARRDGITDVAQARQRTTRIIEMGTLASEIIDRLRSLYKKEPSKRESLAVNEAIREMVELLRGQATRHAVSLRADLASDLPNVIADRVQVQQVLLNLLLNGVEAMSDTGGVLTVKSQLRKEGQIEISVDDTGHGLPPGKADQIFDAFFTTKPKGTGMGLAISKSIVESHGGRIWANGNIGCGARFHFTLPAAPAQANDPPEVE